MGETVESFIARSRPSYSDYKAWVTKEDLWEAKEFVCLIHGGQVQNIKDTLTYKALIADIKDGLLKSAKTEGLHYLPPRVLLDWAEPNPKIIIPEALKRYINYEYWKEKKYWTLDEAIILLTSEKCPLPSEVSFSTLEKEDTSSLAHKLANRIEEILSNSNRTGMDYLVIVNRGVTISKHGISKYFILGWAQGNGLIINEALLKMLEDGKKHNDAFVNNSYNFIADFDDYRNWLKLPSCTLREVLAVFAGFKIEVIRAKEGWINYLHLHAEEFHTKNLERYNKMIDLFLRAGVIDVSTMRQGIAIASWHLDETLRLFEAIDIPQETTDAIALWDWLRAKNIDKTTLSYIRNYAPNSLRSGGRHKKAVELLVEHNFLLPYTDEDKKTIRINQNAKGVKI